MMFTKPQDIKFPRLLNDQAGRIVRALKGNEVSGMCCCPAHDDKSPSLHVSDVDGKLLLHCFAGCSQENVIAALDSRGLWQKQEREPTFVPTRYELEIQKRDKLRKACAILRTAASERRTPKAYLNGRGLRIVPENAMLLSAKQTRHYTGVGLRAMVLPIIGPSGLQGAQVTFLNRNLNANARKGDGKNSRKIYGSAAGGYIYAGELDDKKPLIVAEGFETALAAAQLTGLPAVAAISSGNMKSNFIPPPCTELIIAADNDEPGRQAAESLASRMSVPVRIAYAPVGDWNDALRSGDDPEKLKRLILEAPMFRRDDGDLDGISRPKIQCPNADGELTPVMKLLDGHLLTKEPLPPMRSIEGWPVEVRKCEPIGLHELSADGANAEETETSRLPSPAAYSIVRHTLVSLSMLIERHVAFYRKDKEDLEVQKRLPSPFISAFLEYSQSRLPRVASIATLPIVLPNGELLSVNGLDRKRKIAFCIDDEIEKLMPSGPVRKDEVKSAMRFLLDEWLVDVSTDLEGKCAIIALALTILERELLGERPAFFIVAGRRGGGKTTTAHMVSLAVFGKRASAASWSPNEEERRKAIFAALLQGVPLICFDNIKRGSAVSCPTLEKMLTSPEMRDRVLKESREERVSTKSIIVATGNNISPKGDLASRSLITRIDVDRPDPENREFVHPDPFGWTLDNRGKILTALYTLMLGNPRLKQKAKDRPAAKTRFKQWWHIVGSAIEYAASLIGEDINFGRMFLDVEADDEETTSLEGLLPLLDKFADGGSFRAHDVANWMDDDTDDDAEALRSALQNREGKTSLQFITWRLKNNVNSPIWVENAIWQLRSEKSPRGYVSFWLEKKDMLHS